MAVKFVPPRVPLVDVRTGQITREWFLLFQSVFDLSGSGSVPNDELTSLAPASSLDQFLSLIAAQSIGSDQAPPAFSMTMPADNVSPEIGALRDEVAMLRKELDDLRKGVVVL